MEVILIEHVESLGSVGDIVKVKDGYARNFLIPQKKCLRATNDNKAYFEAKRAEIEKENDKKRGVAEADVKKIQDKFFVIIRHAGEDGRLFGSVLARDIAQEFESVAKIQLDKKQVTIHQSIKFLGVYTVKVALHPEVIVSAHINVARTESEAKEAEKEFLNPTKEVQEELPVDEVFSASDDQQAQGESVEEPAEDSSSADTAD